MTRVEQIRQEALNWKTDDNDFIAQTAFEAGARWADAHPMSPWISVKDRLPETIYGTVSKVVMLSLADGTLSTGSLFHINVKKYWEVDIGEDFAEVNDNDYWMPIPELNKSENQ